MNGGNYILDEDGNPQREGNLCKWATWWATANRHLGKDTIGEVVVSTVFLGIDHNWGGGSPVLWETMVFGGKHADEQERYTSKEDALAGHARWVEVVQNEAEGSDTCES